MVEGSAESGTPVPHGTGVLGRVTDGAGHPVAMATLTAAPGPAGGHVRTGPVRQEANVTDEHGEFFLPLPPGAWTVTVTALGHAPVAAVVEVRPATPVRYDVVVG